MASDSNDIILLEKKYKKIQPRGVWKKKKIIPVNLKNFTGLLGYVGTERVKSINIRQRLENHSKDKTNLELQNYCNLLSNNLSTIWKNHNKKSGLWIFIAGIEKKEIRFWYVNNVNGTDSDTGLYEGINSQFKTVNDLDDNYITPRLMDGVTKNMILNKTIFNFRNGAIYPFTKIYDQFNEILKSLILSHDKGFTRPKSIKDFAFIARQRLEFTKRLYSKKHGIYRNKIAPIGGDIAVFALDNKGQIFEYHKHTFNKISDYEMKNK